MSCDVYIVYNFEQKGLLLLDHTVWQVLILLTVAPFTNMV